MSAMKLRRERKQKGTAMVEGVIILLLLFIFLFGLMEAGHLFQFQNTLTDAAREGARFAVAPTSMTNNLPSVAEIRTKAKIFLGAAGIVVPDANIIVTRPVTITVNGVATEFTRVQIQAPYKAVGLALFRLNNLPLKGEALMRNETSP
jgi:Flp pilus assembly protein TadG